MLGRAGVPASAASITFATTTAAADPFELLFADPGNPPSANFVSDPTFNQNRMEVAATTYDFATLSEYSSTSTGTRYRIYARSTAGSNPPDAALVSVDLRALGKTGPTPAVLAGGTVHGLQLCQTSPRAAAFDNYPSADASWIVVHAMGASGQCGTLDDRFVAINPVSGAKTLAQLEPVVATYAANGAITGFLAINHPNAPGGVIPANTPVPLVQVDPTLSTVASTPVVPSLTGSGQNGVSFLSLGTSSGNIWLYFDATGIHSVALNQSPLVANAVTGFTAAAGDTVTNPAVFDAAGTTAYVAVNNAGGSRIVPIDLTNTAAVTAGAAATDPAATAITPIGVTSANVVYVVNDGSAVKSVAPANMAAAPVAIWKAPTSQQSVDGVMGAGGASGPPTAYLVGDTVYFTVADHAAVGPTGSAKQAYESSTPGSASSGSPIAPAAGTSSAVLGVVAPTTLSLNVPATHSAALVLTGGANGSTTAGQAVFASGSVSATLGLNGAAGASLNAIAPLSVNLPTGPTRTTPIIGVAVQTPLLSGLAAALDLYGTGGGGPAQDLAIFSSDGTTPYKQISAFIQ